MIESSIIKYRSETVTIDGRWANSVEFNFDKIWKFKDKLKAKGDWNPKVFSYYHVHPEGMLWYSEKDLNCAKGLHIALGACTNFHIVTFDDGDLHAGHYNLKSFFYDPRFPDKLLEYDEIPLDSYSVYILKALSYGYVTL